MQPCCEEYRKIWPTDYQGYKLVDLQWDRELGEVTESFLLKPTSRSKQRRDGREMDSQVMRQLVSSFHTANGMQVMVFQGFQRISECV